MIDRLRESRWFYILLSVLLAVLIWMYIRDVENPTQEGTYYGVEIQISGERVLEERGLTVASISQKTVNVTVNAPISVHNDLRGNITATVDVSQRAAWPTAIRRAPRSLIRRRWNSAALPSSWLRSAGRW